ncbi:MAG: flagellin [Pseudomonadota bacterium]
MGLGTIHNNAAVDTCRLLSVADSARTKSVARLSSGQRINSAADDAAGLAVSTSMRADMASLRVAGRNAAEATALLQTADGGLEQIGNILVRLKELATQASSANVSSTNRAKLHAEAQKLIQEADRIATSTKYDGATLLDGNYGTPEMTAVAGVEAWFDPNFVPVGIKGNKTYLMQYGCSVGIDHILHYGQIWIWDNPSDMLTDLGEEEYTRCDIEWQYVSVPLASGAPTGGTVDLFLPGNGLTLTIQTGVTNNQLSAFTVGAPGSGTFQLGATSHAIDQLSLVIGNATTGSDGLNLDGLSLATTSGAEAAMSSIDSALSSLATLRGNVGANINRLGYASANLATTEQNTQAAESAIRDADMAAEMTEFTKNQILMDAGTAMLAQANLRSRNMLALLG